MNENMVTWIDLTVIFTYMMLMLSIGFYVYRKAPSFEEYMVAGRSMTTPILVCTLASTYYGLEDLFGTSEFGYNDGIVAYFGYSWGTLCIFLFAAFVLSKRLRSEKFISLPEILERQYGLKAGVLGAVASFMYSIPALSLFALGRVCEVTIGVDAWIGALVLGTVGLTYTLMGGFLAVAITDAIQFVLMMSTLAIGIMLLMGDVGGFAAVEAIAPEAYFSPLGGMPIWLLIAYVASLLSFLVDPGFYQRIFAARSTRQARNAILMAIAIWMAYDWLVTAGGMLATAAVHQGSLPVDLHSNDALLSAIILALPVGLVGVFLAGVLATAMSTMDSYSLVAGTNLAYDIHRPLRNPAASDRELIRHTKIGIVIAWIAGFALAFAFDHLMALWVFMSTGLSSTVLVPIMMGLFWKGKKTPLAGTLSCATGLVATIVFYVAIAMVGVENETYGTFIWSFSIAGVSFDIWQEYALYFTLPMSFLGFLLGNLLGEDFRPTPKKEASA
jgi:SSS family solute:Na+ symporter